LKEGAQWWADAFDAAGYVDAFRVELLPPGVNPMDARYNVIAWVHRETRGWSTGATIVDPRTGEIVRGVVQLGSLRAWQDKLIFESLAGAAREGTGRLMTRWCWCARACASWRCMKWATHWASRTISRAAPLPIAPR
jgi:hypothetical protein